MKSMKRISIVVFITSVLGIIAMSVSGHSFQPGSFPPQTESPTVEFMTAADLKSLVTQKQSVTIIDVRGGEAFATNDLKIKGAVHVKLRRLRYRLGMAPLSTVSRASEVVTYCACPNDELSIKAADVLKNSGFKRVHVLKGGWREWQKLRGPVESASR
jgi:rhodanese-related sulfurtransferase